MESITAKKKKNIQKKYSINNLIYDIHKKLCHKGFNGIFLLSNINELIKLERLQ